MPVSHAPLAKRELPVSDVLSMRMCAHIHVAQTAFGAEVVVKMREARSAHVYA